MRSLRREMDAVLALATLGCGCSGRRRAIMQSGQPWRDRRARLLLLLLLHDYRRVAADLADDEEEGCEPEVRLSCS